MRGFTFPDDVFAIIPKVAGYVYESVTGRQRTDLSACLNTASTVVFAEATFADYFLPYRVLGGLMAVNSSINLVSRVRNSFFGKEIPSGFDEPWYTLTRPFLVIAGAGLVYLGASGNASNIPIFERDSMGNLLLGIGVLLKVTDLYLMRCYNDRIDVRDVERMSPGKVRYWEG